MWMLFKLSAGCSLNLKFILFFIILSSNKDEKIEFSMILMQKTDFYSFFHFTLAQFYFIFFFAWNENRMSKHMNFLSGIDRTEYVEMQLIFFYKHSVCFELSLCEQIGNIRYNTITKCMCVDIFFFLKYMYWFPASIFLYNWSDIIASFEYFFIFDLICFILLHFQPFDNKNNDNNNNNDAVFSLMLSYHCNGFK